MPASHQPAEPPLLDEHLGPENAMLLYEVRHLAKNSAKVRV